MRTGQTSAQEPQSVEAKGREAWAAGSRAGASTEPMGPGTVTP